MKKFSDLNLFEDNKIFVHHEGEIKEETIIGLKIHRISVENILCFDLTTKEGLNYTIDIEKVQDDICYFKDNKNKKICISTSIERLLLEILEV